MAPLSRPPSEGARERLISNMYARYSQMARFLPDDETIGSIPAMDLFKNRRRLWWLILVGKALIKYLPQHLSLKTAILL